MSFPKCVEYYTSTPIGIIISFHGGCFSGGNMSYDKEQNNLLSNMGFIVYQPEFPKKYSEFKKWCQEYIPSFQKRNLTVYVLGRSSGGYLAKYVYKNYLFINGAIYLCPILFPKERYQHISKFQSKTMSFFDEEEENMSVLNNNEFMILSTIDENIPYQLFDKVIGGHIYYDSTMSHTEVLKCCDERIKNFIEDFCKEICVTRRKTSIQMFLK